MTGFVVVIPSRYASERLPGKPLRMIGGKPMLQHVYERARESSAAEVIVATDDARIENAARFFGADVVLTADDHASGTDRIAEVARIRAWPADTVVVNVQGDAPFLPGSSIDQVAELLGAHPSASLATLAVPIDAESEMQDRNTVKVVIDAAGRALYFSRAAIPAHGHEIELDGQPHGWRHIGLYAYRVEALARLTTERPCMLERREKLEQLRALWLGMEIRVGESKEVLGPDVDTPEDLMAAQEFIKQSSGG